MTRTEKLNARYFNEGYHAGVRGEPGLHPNAGGVRVLDRVWQAGWVIGRSLRL